MRHFDLEGASAARRTAHQRRRATDGPKRFLDILGVCLAAPFVLPIVGIAALLVRRDGGPVFYAHKRIGRNGKLFACWKLRTMVPDSQQVLRQHLRADREAAREWAQTYKLRNDPRVTPVGRFLRRSSIDELPQFWNVLKGEMSLVGPRPVTADELAEYGSATWAYLLVRPGITGLWQVSGRNEISYTERVALDLRYVVTCSLWQDLRILWRTIGAVLRQTGR